MPPNARYCDCEDYPCCGHTDNPHDSPYSEMTDEEIKQSVYDMDEDDFERGEY